jgi:mono/diheme cytochrome c family protein
VIRFALPRTRLRGSGGEGSLGRRMRRALALLLLVAGTSAAAQDEAVRRGEYVFHAAGCLGCHTAKEGKPLAGGRALDTPFGVYYAPNITPDPETGIGRWSPEDFRRALRHGEMPSGAPYFPVFPYTSFTGMTDGDIADLFAYLKTREAVAQPNKPHEVQFPFGWRFLMRGWRMLYFEEGPLQPVANQSAEWNRGRYLTEALGHCGECHTPRNPLGGLESDRAYAGVRGGPDGQNAPNITPHESGIKTWSIEDITTLLASGQTPEFDYVGSGMGEVVANSTSKLTDADRRAIAVYLKSLPPKPGPKRAEK